MGTKRKFTYELKEDPHANADSPTVAKPITVVSRSQVDAVSLSNAAIRVLSFENTLIDQNIISFTGPHVVHYISSQNISAFQNLAPDGAVLPYFEEEAGGGGSGTFIRQDGLENKVADACLMGFL